ncbi:MAG: 2,4'-dihydroxyacetophenone dioxygenase family protein [Chloroflexota bacterium]|nr:MAG: cupin [Chloroflexota bacterium]
MVNQILHDHLAEYVLPDRVHNIDDLPWVPQGEQVWFKPLRFDLVNGRWVNLLRVTKAGKVNRHRHSAQVLGFCLHGTWQYAERDWIARPGSFVFEPPGDVHTLLVDGSEEMQTLFLLEGTIQYMDDDNRLISEDNVFTKLDRYLAYCREHSLNALDLRY